MNAALLEVEDLRVGYDSPAGAVTALDGVSLRLAPGEALGLLGESGAGKSSLARALPGLLPPEARVAGSVRLEGRELVGLGEAALRPLRGAVIASIFQEPGLALNPVRRVGDQIGDVIDAHAPAGAERRRARVAALLEQVSLEPAHARAWPHQLSGGERQRVAIAQAVAAEPRLLIADEPTTALDPVTRRELLEVLGRLRRTQRLALLLVSHSLAALEALVEQVAVLYAGRVVERGPLAELRRDPAHPYTRGLLASMPPRLTSAPVRPRPIPGAPPEPGERGRGCAFEPRCAERLDECATAPPPETPLPGDRRVRCYLHGS